MIQSLSIERLDPDIAILDRVAVVLEQERPVLAFRDVDSARRGRDLGVVDGLDPVVDHGHSCFLDDLALLDHGLVKRDVVGLPLERWLAGVDRRYDLLVDRAAVVVVQFQPVGVEDLELVDARQIDAAVAAALPALWACRAR